MKTLSELAAEVYQSRNNPGMLADVHITLATVYSNLNEEMMECQLKKADFWQVKDTNLKAVQSGKPLSDTAVEMMWLQTEDGRKEIKLKYTLRSLEKLMSAAKSSMVNSAVEAKNI